MRVKNASELAGFAEGRHYNEFSPEFNHLCGTGYQSPDPTLPLGEGPTQVTHARGEGARAGAKCKITNSNQQCKNALQKSFKRFARMIEITVLYPNKKATVRLRLLHQQSTSPSSKREKIAGALKATPSSAAWAACSPFQGRYRNVPLLYDRPSLLPGLRPSAKRHSRRHIANYTNIETGHSEE